MSPARLLVLDGVSKSFGRVVVAEDLTSPSRRARRSASSGPNGAGSPRLFDVISGDLPPDAGTVPSRRRTSRARPRTSAPRAGIGRTYQVPRPFDHMTVFENVLVSRAPGRRPARAARPAAGGRGAGPHRPGRRGEPAGRPARRCCSASGWRWRAPRRPARKLLLLDEVAGGLTDAGGDRTRGAGPRGARSRRRDGLDRARRARPGHAVDRLVCLAGGASSPTAPPTPVLADPEVRELYLGGEPRRPRLRRGGGS